MQPFYYLKMQNKNLYISNYCLISKRQVIANGLILQEESEFLDLSSFLDVVFKGLKSDYDAFSDLSLLNKLCFVTAEILLNPRDMLSGYKGEEIALLLSNANANLDVDNLPGNRVSSLIADNRNLAYLSGRKPNIMMDLLSQRYKVKGENNFFVSQVPNFELLHDYTNLLFETGRSKAVVTGWINLQHGADFSSILFLVENRHTVQSEDDRYTFSVDAMESFYNAQNLTDDDDEEYD